MSNKSGKEQCSAFLYIISQAGRDIFYAFVEVEPGDND